MAFVGIISAIIGHVAATVHTDATAVCAPKVPGNEMEKLRFRDSEIRMPEDRSIREEKSLNLRSNILDPPI